MGFWDDINRVVDEVFGIPDKNTPFPSSQDATTSDPYATALGTAENLTPDFQPAPLIPAVTSNDPFSNNTEQLIQVQSLNTSPFTVIDLNPYLATGTRKYDSGISGTPAGPTHPNTIYAVSQSTLKQIANALNTLGLNTSINALSNVGANSIGVTYPYQITAKSLRIEQLPFGGGPLGSFTPAYPPFSNVKPNTVSVNTPLTGNDVRAQQVLGLFLNGLFLQFETPDAPIFIAKPGEIYQLPFTKVFVTTFGSGPRWRLIFGSGDSVGIQGFSDQRALRQNLHLWDGSGVFDNSMLHPIPFTTTMANGAGATGILAALTPATFNTNSETFEIFQPPGETPGPGAGNLFLTNHDTGASLVQQGGANGPVVGSVVNKGYLVFWITGYSFTVLNTASGQIYGALGKAIAPWGNLATTADAIDFRPSVFLDPIILNNDSVSHTVNFQVPLRIVLAGFDTYQTSTGGVQATGETFFVELSSSVAFSACVTLNGYYYPALLPFCPYPMDSMALPPAGQ